MRADDPLLPRILGEKLRNDFSAIVQPGQKLEFVRLQRQNSSEEIPALFDEPRGPGPNVHPPRSPVATEHGDELPGHFLWY